MKIIAPILLLSSLFLAGCNGLHLGSISLGPDGNLKLEAKLPSLGQK